MLIEAGAEIDRRDNKKETPLHAAARSGRHAIAKQLIELGADVNAQCYLGNTPLHVVRGHPLENMEATAKVLVDANANITIKDSQGKTPYDCTASSTTFDVAVKCLKID